MEKKSIREAKVERFKQIWITKDVYEVLRRQKMIQEKSMTEIVNDVIMEKYVSLQAMPEKQLETQEPVRVV